MVCVLMNIIYIRTSTEDQEPKLQIDSCKKLFPDEEFILLEDKQSAFTEKRNRKGFERAKTLIKNQRIDKFIAWDLDRIYRNRKRLKEFFGYCKLYKTSIYSNNQQWLNKLARIPEPFNEIVHGLMLDIMGWLAEDESKKKSDRIKLAIRKEDGKTKSYKGNDWGRPKKVTQRYENDVLRLHRQGMSIRNIAQSIWIWDKYGNKKFIGRGTVHKILLKNRAKS